MIDRTTIRELRQRLWYNPNNLTAQDKRILREGFEISIADVEKTIEFFESIPEKNFCVGQQTEGIDREQQKSNIGKSHCALGHLGVNPNSPFYDSKYIPNDEYYVVSNSSFGCRLNDLCFLMMNVSLVAANNSAYMRPEAGIKARVIGLLKDLKERL